MEDILELFNMLGDSELIIKFPKGNITNVVKAYGIFEVKSYNSIDTFMKEVMFDEVFEDIYTKLSSAKAELVKKEYPTMVEVYYNKI